VIQVEEVPSPPEDGKSTTAQKVRLSTRKQTRY